MKEKWIGNIHFVFYKNFDIQILPSINIIPKCESHHKEVIFGFLRCRVCVFKDTERLEVRGNNFEMIAKIRLALTDVPESRFDMMETSLKEVYEWFDTLKLRLY